MLREERLHQNGKKRPGGRTARVRTAVLRAFVQELAEVGYASVRFEAVAKRAGVHKTTLYRRWPSCDALLLEAALEYPADSVPLPDTGSLRDDLFLLARHVAESLKSPAPQAMLRAVIMEAARNPELADSARAYWRTRFQHIGAIVQRGIERGEVSFSIDPRLVIEALVGPMYLRTLVTQEPVDDDVIKGVVDLVVAAATGDSVVYLDRGTSEVSAEAAGARKGAASG